MVSFELLHRLQRYRPLSTLSDIVFAATCSYFLANKLCVDDTSGSHRLRAVVKMVCVVLRDEPIFRECVLDASPGAAVVLSEDEQLALALVVAPSLYPPPPTSNNNSNNNNHNNKTAAASSSSSSSSQSAGDSNRDRDTDHSAAAQLTAATEVIVRPYYTSPRHPLNPLHQHTLSPHHIDTPHQHTLSTHSINTSYQHTLSTHSIL